MTIEEAKKEIKNKVPLELYDVYLEYEEYFVFHKKGKTFNGSLMVEKETGLVTSFSPLKIPVEEFKNPKSHGRVGDSK